MYSHNLSVQVVHNSVRYRRRGWDFTMQNVLKWFYEDASFRAATEAAEMDSQDPGNLFGSAYMYMLDRDCKNVLFGRTHPSEAGVYGLGMILQCRDVI